MSKPKKTKAPNYAALATQQAGLAKENWTTNLRAARPNQYGPEGTNTWSQNPAGDWTNTMALSQPRQELYDLTNQKAQEQLKGFDTRQVDLSGARQAPEVGQYNQQATDLYNQLAAPELRERMNADRARRTAMGLGEGSGQAWDSGERNLNDALSRSGMMGAQAGIQQGNVMFGQGMDLHRTGVSDILNQNTANLQKVGDMMGQSNSFRMPTFGPAPTPGMPGAATPDMTRAADASYKAALDKYNAKAGSGLAGQLLPIAGSVAGSFFGPMGSAIGGQLGKSIGGMMSSPTIPTGGAPYDFSGGGTYDMTYPG